MLDFFTIQNRDLFEGIQGNILKAHGRPHTANVFIRGDAGKQPDAKDWLRRLVDGDNAIIQSGYAQLRSNVLWKENRMDTGLFACIHISAAGYNYLFGNHDRPVDSSFQKGMKGADLNDASIESWDAGLRIDNHFMLLLASENTELLKASLATIAETIQLFGSITTIEQGKAQFNGGAGIEHFGYVDGVSQPLFFEDEWQKYKTDNDIQEPVDIKFDPRAEKELVLVPDPFVNDTDPNAFGSYFVFRKLEQNVRGFKQAESDLAHQLGLTGEDEERAGAMLVGRFEDGTPIQLDDEAGAINSAVLNNFDYDSADASKCPFHAHIRKTNPRSGLKEGGMEEAKKHIMARRGIPYGMRADDPNDGQIMNKPERDVGLLFMSYQASIINQFEFIQKNWSNNPNSPHLNPDDPDGLDPVIGQGGPKYATKWGNSGTLKSAGFGQFVHMKGGEYFFAPSMSFLKNIDPI